MFADTYTSCEYNRSVFRYGLSIFSALLITVTSACAQDPALKGIHELLAPLREHPEAHAETRGATPVFDSIKHRLREWVDGRIQTLAPDGDEAYLATEINSELRRAELFCGGPGDQQCPEWGTLGFLGPVRFQRSRQFLVANTAVGIQDCGRDWSSYIYEWRSDRWQRVWESEQNTYTEEGYRPQTLLSVLISPDHLDGRRRLTDHLVLTLGSNSWCTSNWQGLYYRLWSVDSTQSKLILDANEIAFDGPSTAVGTVTHDEMLVEFRKRSIDAAVHNREAIRHYRFDGRNLTRDDPVALNPRSFVDEWLTNNWPESSSWSEQTSIESLKNRHEILHSDFVSGDFYYPTLHCSIAADLWQVGVDLHLERPGAESVFFTVRWRPPYHFKMVAVSDKPSPDCTIEDREADTDRTLFPGSQRW